MHNVGQEPSVKDEQHLRNPCDSASSSSAVGTEEPKQSVEGEQHLCNPCDSASSSSAVGTEEPKQSAENDSHEPTPTTIEDQAPEFDHDPSKNPGLFSEQFKKKWVARRNQWERTLAIPWSLPKYDLKHTAPLPISKKIGLVLTSLCHWLTAILTVGIYPLVDISWSAMREDSVKQEKHCYTGDEDDESAIDDELGMPNSDTHGHSSLSDKDNNTRTYRHCSFDTSHWHEFLNSDYLEQEERDIYLDYPAINPHPETETDAEQNNVVTRAFILILACCMNLVETCAQALKTLTQRTDTFCTASFFSKVNLQRKTSTEQDPKEIVSDDDTAVLSQSSSVSG